MLKHIVHLSKDCYSQKTFAELEKISVKREKNVHGQGLNPRSLDYDTRCLSIRPLPVVVGGRSICSILTAKVYKNQLWPLQQIVCLFCCLMVEVADTLTNQVNTFHLGASMQFRVN